MTMCMREYIFEKMDCGKAALKKLGNVPKGFRFYCAGWVEKNPKDFDTMRLDGAVFREAIRGPNKGKMTVKVKGTERTVYVTNSEMDEFWGKE